MLRQHGRRLLGGAVLCLLVVLATPAAGAAAGPLFGQPQLIDMEAPFAVPRHIDGVSCVLSSFCAAIDGSSHVLISTDPGASLPTWRLQTVRMNAQLTAISCPTVSFCAVGDKKNELFTSRDPARPGGGEWSRGGEGSERSVITPEGIESLDCSSRSLCVAVSAGEGEPLSTVERSSRDPSSSTRADWQTRVLRGEALRDVSCPSTRLCVAVGFEYFAVSRDPASPHATWRRARARSQDVEGVSCPSEQLCVAYDERAYLTTTDPLDGAKARWSTNGSLPAGLGPQAKPSAISCASVSLCVLTALDGTMTISSDPALGAAATWQPLETHAHYYLDALSCVTDLCVAGSTVGRAVAVHPLTKTYASRFIDGYDPLLAVSCAGDFCAATGQGKIFTTADAKAHEPAWSHQQLDGTGLDGVSCPSQDFCAAAGADGSVLVSSAPTSPGSWHATRVAGAEGLSEISCVGRELCVALDRSGNVYSSTNPATGGPASWARDRVPNLSGGAADVSCGSIRLCVLAGLGGGIATSTDPTLGAASHWSERVIYSSMFLGVSCVGERFCVLSEWSSGSILLSTDPARGAAARWRGVGAFREFPPEDGTSVSCLAPERCVVAEERGRYSLSSDVLSRHPQWHTGSIEPGVVTPPNRYTIGLLAPVDPTRIQDVSCTDQFCGVVDTEGHFARIGSSR